MSGGVNQEVMKNLRMYTEYNFRNHFKIQICLSASKTVFESKNFEINYLDIKVKCMKKYLLQSNRNIYTEIFIQYYSYIV